MQPVIYVDLRWLQDPGYRARGIGHHVSALLRTRNHSLCSGWKTIGLIDAEALPLPDECSYLVDEVSSSPNPICKGAAAAVFIDGTPMTHDTRFTLRFQGHPAFVRAAVVHDFIPLDWPGYLPTTASRIDYFAKMARLRRFDLFFPVSEYSAWRLSELLGISRSRMQVTGSSVRRSLYEIKERYPARSYDVNNPYFLIVVGGDVRKNPEVAVKAVRQLNLLYSRRIPLKVAGHYDQPYKENLLRLAGHLEGRGFLEFCPAVSDQELISLFAGATATIASSHIEGFSLPVVEASVCGCPVIASTCAAHLELIQQPEALFLSDDSAALAERLEKLLNDPHLRDSLVASQAYLGPKFHEKEVGKRFWTGIHAGLQDYRLAPSGIAVNRKPRVAFLSPYPPDESGAARYTAMTIRAGKHLFESDLYTNAPRPLTFEGCFRDGGRVSLAPLITGRENAVVSVLGNHPYHMPVFDFFERYGGPCILHDSRLTQVYFSRFGQGKFVQFASKLLSRSVTTEEANAWLQDRNPPSLFLDPIIERASPLIVHTMTQQAQIKERYGVDAHVTTCCPTMFFSDHELSYGRRQAVRERYGVDPASFLISSFGYPASAKGMETCILALDLLRSWNIAAELYFVGNASAVWQQIARIAALYGLEKHVHAFQSFVDAAMYRDFLVASDAAVQLRTYGFGQLSAALMDCISAGLPSVSSSELALSCQAPDFVWRVPDRYSPLQVAEQLASIWDTGSRAAANAEARAAYLDTHNFDYYTKRLAEILGIA